MEKMIEVRNARCGYGDRPILDQVSFTVSAGEFVGIIGSNGAGKSTLLRLLLGTLSPDTGTVSLLGRPASGTDAMPGVGYVPQHGLSAQSGFPATAEEIVLSGLYADIGRFRPVRRRHRELARQALERVGMADAAHALAGTLSGGQLQRVLLARVLAGRPRLLLLDEPLTGIDTDSAEKIHRLLRDLSREDGTAVLMVTHDIAGASRYLDRILCLEFGTLVELEQGQIEHELQHRHRHPPQGTGPACGWPREGGSAPQTEPAPQPEEEPADGHL